MKRLLVVLVSFVFVGVASAGIKKNHLGTCEKIDAYIQARDMDSVAKYEPISLRKESLAFLSSKDARCRSFGYHLRAEYELSQYQFDAAKLDLDREKYILDSLKLKGIPFLHNYVGYGDFFLRTGNFQSAIENYNKALSLLNKAPNRNLQARVLLALSTAQSRIKQEDKARAYVNLAHPFVVRLVDGPGKVDNLFSLSSRYHYLYKLNNDQTLLDSSQRMAVFGLRLAQRIGYTDSYVKGYNLLEDKAYFDHNFRVALLYLDSALLFTSPNANFSDRLGIYADMADVYLELKKYDKAYQFADSSLTYALKLGNPYKVKDALELVYNCSKLSGEYERALLVYEELVVMRDSVNELQQLKVYNELEERFYRVRSAKSEKLDEQDRKLLQQQREIGNLREKLIIIGIVVFAVLGFYIVMVFRQKNIKQKQKNLEIQQRLNRARINPDFIYKALSGLQAGGTNSGDFNKKLAAFSKLIKQTLESSHDDFLTLDKEVEFLTYYLDLQRDRLKQQFDYEFIIDESLNPTNVCLPTMILQPFIENSVEQGFKNLSHTGHLIIRFTRTPNNELSIVLQDNGRGLKAVDSSRASGIINDRLYLLNKINRTSSSYLIRDRQSGGVSVEIFLPLITKAYAEQLRKEGLF